VEDLPRPVAGAIDDDPDMDTLPLFEIRALDAPSAPRRDDRE
jgi:hypothetical protein